MRALLVFLFLWVFQESSQSQDTPISPIDHRDVGNYNFLDGKFFNTDSLKHEELYYDKLISFKIFFKNSVTLWYQFLRIDDTSFLETKYFSDGKMEEKVRYTILDSVFSTDTVALMNIEGEILRDTLIFDTVINLVRDGRANFYDSLGFNLHKEYSTGKARKEVYWNYEIGYEMWSIGYDATKDTLFFNHILKDNKSELSKILSGKKWMASGESASNFFSQKENAVSKFEIGKEYGRVGLSFSQPDSENHITISVRRTEDTEDFNGKWKLEEGNHLTIELGKKRLDYLILFLDDEQMMLKLISDTE